MKKIVIILFLCVFSICVVREKVQNVFIEKVDLKLKEGEIGIVFIPVEESSHLLIKTKEETILLGLEENDISILPVLKKLGQTEIDYNISKQNIGKNKISLEEKFSHGNIEITKKEDNYLLKLQNHYLTVYLEGVLEETEYVYFLENTEIEKGDIKLAFYKEGIGEEFEKELMTYWIDSYKIKVGAFTIVKFSEDSYNVIRIPEYYF